MTMSLVRHLARMRSISYAMTILVRTSREGTSSRAISALNINIKTLVLRF